jgi:hypothetical protein
MLLINEGLSPGFGLSKLDPTEETLVLHRTARLIGFGRQLLVTPILVEVGLTT